jgi:universal stress protein E
MAVFAVTLKTSAVPLHAEDVDMPGVVMAAVREPDRTARPLLRKAALLARAHKAQLHLVHVIALPSGPLQSGPPEVRRAARELLQARREALARLERAGGVRGVRVTSHVAWDYPASDGLVREVLKRRPLLLVAESHRHGRLARAWLTNTDWELIRNCPCPLWLSKSDRLSLHGRVLAALDPMHQHAKPAGLDGVILRSAIDAAGGDRKHVLAFCANAATQPIPIGGKGVVEAYWLSLSDEERDAHAVEVRRRLSAEAERCGVPQQNLLIASGDPVYLLPRISKQHKASVVVMGALSRRGLQRLFIGNTAERVIDELTCDVLIVKPRRFKTPVTRHAARSRIAFPG